MKYPHSIPLCQTNGKPFPGGTPSRVILSSVGTKWNDLVVEQHLCPSFEVADVMHKRHAIAINIGHSFTWEFKKAGRFQRVFKARGAISFCPSDQPFSGRLKVERSVFANFLFLALDPVFVSRVAEGLEFDADRIELIEQRRSTDPTLRHIALALRAGIQTGDALDRMYGEAISTALAVHLLRKYSAAVLEPKRQYGGLPREKLVRAVEYIQDQLDTDLTVSGIAQAVYISPYHFAKAVQRIYRPVTLPVCRRGQGKESERTSDNKQVHHQRSCTACRFRRSEPSYTSFQKSFRLTS